jgi:ATP-dependent RNA helicase DeaD
MTEFEGVVPALSSALEQRGYSVLTPVQKAVIAPELADKDLLVSAQTGSGKTVAFGMAFAPNLLQGADRFERADAPLALAVAPTRELALQVKRELEWLYEKTGASFASCVGGMDMRDERRALSRGAHIVVGTPGRLRDHIERGSLDMGSMRAVVLDEADEMLDMGFRDDLEYILGAAPEERRTLMFSATVPRMIATLAKRYQNDAVRVSTKAEESQHLDIDYRALAIAPNDRENAIVNVLRYFEAKNTLIFCSTRATVNHMTSRFANRGFSVVALSGELSQNERTHALQSMRDGRARVCVATDVAARGIDLPNLELVIHADIPKSKESLVHRSGRTGRAGRKGVCALIVPYNQRRRTESLLQRAKISATWGKPPTIEEIIAKDDERLLGDPSLSEPLQEKEKAMAGKLLEAHSADQIAAAFVRLYRKEQTAPEELLDAPMDRGRGDRRGDRQGGSQGDRSPRSREDFTDGVWFSLSIGRKQNAEPRWLLPMLCRAGGLTKRDIGAIRIDQAQTSVELAPKCVDRFLEALGPDKTMEKNITVKRLDGPPKGGGSAPPARRYDKKRPFGDKKSSDRSRPPRRDQKGGSRNDGPPRERSRADEKARPEPWRKPAGEAKPRASEKPASTAKPASTDKPASEGKSDSKPKWNPLDASSKRSGGKSRDDKASGRPKRKSAAKKKLSPSKIRRAKAREQLSLKSGHSSKSGQSSTPGMAPRKRKDPKS